MSKINLLPWREERRRELKNQFLAVLAGAAFVGFAVIYVMDLQVNNQIEHQKQRNQFVRQETSSLDKQIAEIAELRKKRERLVERMGVIQNLQGNRHLIVHVFDEIAKDVPDGVFFTAIDQSGAGVSAQGLAESNTRISNLMRNIDASPSFAKAQLSKVEAQTTTKVGDKNWSGFSMTFQIQPKVVKSKGGEG